MANPLSVLVYHKNIRRIYEPEWIELFKKSIREQECVDFRILEMNYGGDDYRVFEESELYQADYPNFIYALNDLIEIGSDSEYLFNTNCDDWYDPCRLYHQVMALEQGYDLVSSNFSLTDPSGKIVRTHRFDTMDLAKELKKNHNIICHPVVAYRSSFFAHKKYDPNAQPAEDLKLWQKMIHTKKFTILPEVLCYHRIHGNSVCNSRENR